MAKKQPYEKPEIVEDRRLTGLEHYWLQTIEDLRRRLEISEARCRRLQEKLDDQWPS